MSATQISRQRNFVSDRNNSIPITASYMDGELNQIIGSLNSKCIAAAVAPSSPTTGDSWIDTSTNPPIMKVYNGTSWSQISASGTFPKTVLLMGA